MNLSALFELQRELDARIEQEHPTQPDEDRVVKKILALQVELGELANEWRGFKFWSKNQDPRVVYKGGCKKCDYWQAMRDDSKTGKLPDGSDCDCYQGIKRADTVLEEYVDCLHFILSIGLEIVTNEDFDFDDDWEYLHEHNFGVFNEGDTLEQFRKLFGSITEFSDNRDIEVYQDVFLYFIALGDLLSFTHDQIEAAYRDKHRNNLERQASGY